MKKLIPILLPLLFSTTLYASKNDPEDHSEDNRFTPVSGVLAEAIGDLDKDGKDEKVVALNVVVPGQPNAVRPLLIFKQDEYDNWFLWQTREGGILGSDQGGLLGDPFESLEISRGTIVIKHFGGSAQKWNYTHRFRFNGTEWPLIGTTIKYGIPGCYEIFDFNLANGKAIYKEIKRNCWSDEEIQPTQTQSLSIKLDKKPTLNNFSPGSNTLKIDQLDKTIYY